VARVPGRRPLWLTLPLYALLTAVVVLDVRAAFFWGRVGGSLGTAVAVAAGALTLTAALLMGCDPRRQVARASGTEADEPPD